MISVAEALRRTLGDVRAIAETETVPLAEAVGRTLASDVVARRDQPPFPASAMDGYAVRAVDIAPGKVLRVVGTSRAGCPLEGSIGPGEVARILTGAAVPEGADAILIQENAVRQGETMRALAAVEAGRFVRPRGFDFAAGDALVRAGDVLDAGRLSLAAAAGADRVATIRPPRVALIATGDEIVMPGAEPGPAQIFASSITGVGTVLREVACNVIPLGVAADTRESLAAAFDAAEAARADLVVTLGGASVGDHDLVRPVLVERGVELAFEKVAIRPGKPLMHGRDANRLYLGLPGNPVSSLVCARVFGLPLLAALQGRGYAQPWTRAELGGDLPANDEREEFMRCSVTVLPEDGRIVAHPFARQDSSLVSRYAEADALFHRPANAPATGAGATCRIIPLRPLPPTA